MLGVSLADGGNLVVTGCRDSSLQIWDLLSRPPLLENRQHQNSATSVSISPCGTYGVSGGEDSRLKLYDLEKASIVGELETGTRGVTRVLVLRDSECILVAYLDGSMQLWNGVLQELLVRFEGHRDSAVNCIAVSLDSSLVMSGGEDCVVSFWSVKSGAKLKAFRNHATAVVGVAFTQDRMLSASRDGQVGVRDFKTAKVLSTSTTHTEELLCLAASSNAAFFATGSRDGTCHVVDLATGQLKCILNGHRSSVTCVRVLSDCTQCLTGSEDNCLRVWDVEDGRCLAELHTDAPLTSCDISWKSDHVLYGTKGGWVSSAVYKAREKVKELILQKIERCESESGFSMAGSESVTSATTETTQEHTAAETKEDGRLATDKDNREQTTGQRDCPEVSTTSTQFPNQLNTTERAEVESMKGSYPIDVNVEVISHQPVMSTPHKESGLDGFVDLRADMQAHLRNETVTGGKELETEEGNTKATSSACLIL